jgi:hypothetical protein
MTMTWVRLARMRTVTAALALLVASACKGPPVRLVAGNFDTVVVSSRRPVQLPVRVFDAAGHALQTTGVRYRWTSGVRVPVSAAGMVTCMQPGDATVNVSLGEAATSVLLLCRPVRDVRALPMMNLVVGAPAKELALEAFGLDGRPVTLLTAQITVEDSTIATVDGARIRALAPGETNLTMRVGDRQTFASVHTYERVLTPERILPGQHLAVTVRLTGGEMQRWRLPAAREIYFVAMIPDNDEERAPGLAIVGANCGPARVYANSYFCLAQHDASVIVYHPQQVDSAQALKGTLAIWRQEHP